VAVCATAGTDEAGNWVGAAWTTDSYLRELLAAHRWDSDGMFPFTLPHLRLDTEQLTADETAQRSADHFLPSRSP
jgi:hypothetical protein